MKRVDSVMGGSGRLLKISVWGVLVCLGLFSSVSRGNGEMETPRHQCLVELSKGEVNWSTGKVYARGKAVPVDRKKADSPDFILSVARSDARRNLIETLKHLEIYAGYSVASLAMSDDHILAGIEKNAMDATLVKQSYTSDRTMEVVLETSLFGGFLQLVLPEEIKSIPTLQIIDPPKTDSPKTVRENQPEYTGLIIDATAIGFQPVLYPVVVSELGSEIYSALFISREIAVQQGVCRYMCTVDPVEAEKWVGKNPIQVKGLRKGGVGNSSLVISRSDADRIEKTRERHRFMRECRVIILVAPADRDTEVETKPKI